MKCYRIEKENLKAFAVEMKIATSMENIKKAFAQQADGAANYYVTSPEELAVCQKYGKLNDQHHNSGR